MKVYINNKLGFYFDGGFEKMILDAQLDQEEIEKWGSLAILFEHCFGDVSEFTSMEKENAFCLVESLYTKIEVDLMFGEIDKSALEEICEGYDFECEQYKSEIDKGIALIEVKGLDLFKLIP